MIGVKGWCSANQASPAGIESVGTKRAGEERQQDQRHRRVARGLDAAAGQPERDAQPGHARPISRIMPAAPTHPATEAPPR